jgi:hypothetical protein
MADGNSDMRNLPLSAWVRRGAVNVRVYVSVVERACQDRHGGRADAAAVHGVFVIAALPSRDTADDQPDDKQYRSNVHLGPPSASSFKKADAAKRPHGGYLGRHPPRSISMRVADALSRNLEVGWAAEE